MHLNADISAALQLLEEIKQNVDSSDDPKLQANTSQDLKLLISVLENPIFRSIVTVQDSLSELNQQLGQHPSILPVDFDITASGELDLSVPPRGAVTGGPYEPQFGSGSDFDEQRVPSAPVSPSSPHLHTFNVPDNNKGVRRPASAAGTPSGNVDDDTIVQRSPSAVSDASKAGSDATTAAAGTPPLLGTEWAHVEAIDLVNDGTGLGFGIVGVRTMGVVVKTILPGGVADRDGRLLSGDHILQIGEVNLHEMGSEQVAAVLRQSGTHVRLIVARPATGPDQMVEGGAALVPTRLITEPSNLDRYLIHHNRPPIFRNSLCGDTAELDDGYLDRDYLDKQEDGKTIYHHTAPTGSSGVGGLSRIPASPSLPLLNLDMAMKMMPEMEQFSVELQKDANGLGITIAGYVCEKEELSGIFVKSVSKGSAADVSGQIRVNDRIVAVDGRSLHGHTNLQAVEVLRNSGRIVRLRLERYLHGPKFEQLQQAIAASELKPQLAQAQQHSAPPSSPPRYARLEEDFTHDSSVADDSTYNLTAPTTVPSTFLSSIAATSATIPPTSMATLSTFGHPHTTSMYPPASQEHKQYETELTPEIEQDIKRKWRALLAGDNAAKSMLDNTDQDVLSGSRYTEIVVAQLRKFGERGGLGISLEGTVDVEDGQEVRPHHYIRSILPEGPVGKNGKLRSGDELLEVNGHRLLGMNHHEVVGILKELPVYVLMVCGRHPVANNKATVQGDTSQSVTSALNTCRNALGGSLQNLQPTADRLVKAKSDGSISTSVTSSRTSAEMLTTNRVKSRSLEPLTGLAMWSAEPQVIELVKGERGLGFSILDYQDPMSPNDTVIVIRSLVPGGVAQMDGRLIPGDRLLFVNDTLLENASLDQAVQALKGAPKGRVRIAVAKPLPIQLDAESKSLASSANPHHTDK